MKKVLILCLALSLVSITSAALFEDDMSSMTGWSWSSGTGDSGVYVSGGSFIQMNSWNNTGSGNPGWTNMWKNTGVLIEAEKDYTITLSMDSFASGTPVDIGYSYIDGGGTWTDFGSESVSPATGGWADYSVSFSTVGGANAAAVGNTLGLGVAPGWWNNLGVDHVTVVPEPTTMALLGLGSLVMVRRRK